ncbi:MAG: hypothetical protein AB7S70_00640 [Hyphomicrobium sp.]|uniref:hypothetical protein n=1 Tax=Hyphomicrobium sp. TaxID=82 RepID=UPI003D0AD1F5
MKYQPPFEVGFNGPANGIHNSNPTAEYQNGNPATGQEGSIPPMESLSHPMKELVHLIDYSGQTPSHADLEQVRKAIKWMIDNQIAFEKSGDGVDIYHGNVDGKYLLRSLVAGDNITLTVETNGETGETSIKIDAAGDVEDPPAGESNTGANVGATGIGVFKEKSGVELRFRKIEGVNGATATLDGDVIKIAAPGTTPNLATVAPALYLEERRGALDAVRNLVLNNWTRRPVNTSIVNQIDGASLSGEQITLPAGTYRAHFAGAGWRTGMHVTRLWNVTGSVALGLGISCDSSTGSGNGTCNVSSGIARFTLAGPTVIELQAFSAGDLAGKMGNSDQALDQVNGWVEIVKEQ